jgi:hypothetical protein
MKKRTHHPKPPPPPPPPPLPPPSQVCKFYLAGHCAYGDQCRYDHVKPAYAQGRQQEGAEGGAAGSGASGSR